MGIWSFWASVKAISFGSALILTPDANVDLLVECNKMASEINRSTPQQLDAVTTLLGSVCIVSSGVVTIVYRNRLSLPSGTSFGAREFATMKPNMLNAWCTDPSMRPLIDLINIQYTFSDPSGRLLGKIDLNKRECR